MRMLLGIVMALAALGSASRAEEPDPQEWRNALDLRAVVEFVGEGAKVHPRELAAAGLDSGSFQPPKVVKPAKLAYPDAARRERIQGIVVLECLLDDAGKVGACRTRVSVPSLDQAAIDYVHLSKYEPAKVRGEVRSIVLSFSVMFRLY
jgi:TonB family protein